VRMNWWCEFEIRLVKSENDLKMLVVMLVRTGRNSSLLVDHNYVCGIVHSVAVVRNVF